MKHVKIFTDGACRGNPGPGGWGVLLQWEGHEKMMQGAQVDTTNNQMELMAAIKALSALKERCKVDLTTDSQYVRNGITLWLHNWEKNGWKTSRKEEVKNKDLWMELYHLVQQHEVAWHWIKGHSGHPENDKADQLAREAIDQLMAK